MAGVGEVLTSIVLREVARKLGSAARDQVTAQWNFTRDLDGMRTTLESVNALLRLLRDAEQRSALEDIKQQQIASPLPTSVRGALVSPSGRPSSTSSSASVLLRRPHRRGPAVVVASTGRRSHPDGQTDGAARLHLWHRSPPATPDSSISSTTVDRGDKLPALLLRLRSSPTTSPVLPAAGTILRRLTGRPPLGRSPCGFGSSASRAAYDISDMLDEFQSIEPDARKVSS
uniref:Rx N-terminal domain-containing protein n=1 Tax=Oryza nivara TaxID=4536 RepID=A0A0E0HC50_ORYNI